MSVSRNIALFSTSHCLDKIELTFLIEIAAFSKCRICLHPHVSQMEHFSNRAFLKWSNSQMEHFGVATLCHISRSQEQRNMACDVLVFPTRSNLVQFDFQQKHPDPAKDSPLHRGSSTKCAYRGWLCIAQRCGYP